ncbi:MAG: HTTM domain-containing protein [Thermoanaerobaculia bacterium]
MPVIRSLVRALHRAVELRTSPVPLALGRIVAGIAAVLAALEASRTLSRLLQPMIVRLPVLPWIPQLPSGSLRAFIGAWVVAALLFAAGWKTRAAGTVLVLLAGYTLVLDQQTYSNHLYLLVLVVLLLTVSDGGAACSLDAWRHGSREEVAAWPVLLLRAQVVIVYVSSALAKLTGPYLGGEILTVSLRQEGLLAVPQAWRTPSATSLLAVASIATELFVAIGLCSRRLRPIAFVCGAGFHLLILALVDSSRLSLAIFALAMAAMYLSWAEPEPWARRTRRVDEPPLRLTAP